MLESLCARLAVALAGTVLFAAPAWAHPHILIDAKVAIVFNDAGEISGLRHDWSFDAAFSAWVIQGLDTNNDGEVRPEELQELADENVAALGDFGFYTYAGTEDDSMLFRAAGDQRMVYDDGHTVLSYALEALEPKAVTDRFELGVYDAEYYVAITFDDLNAVTLENAPAACRVELEPPTPMAPEVEAQLYALGPEVLELPPELAAAMRGTQGLIVVRCDGAVAAPPQTAIEATTRLAQARPATPFGGPPAEPGLNLPRTGFFGWLQDQQRIFYTAMTRSLDVLRTDWTAFWVLGGLSFLYGVFHAAGPGHGKVVISSYVLANESQLRRGILLSVISAMLQSLVAIVFVLLAAGLLGMSSLAMTDAANWIGIASYGMVALLGLGLIARKLFGWGHSHAHHDHHHDHHHHHGGQCDHLHIVPPKLAGGSWAEQLSVVFAVGLRPCSGALVVLVFALSQGLLAAGIAAVFLMGIGTAITVAVLATLAVSVKGLATRIGGADNAIATALLWWLELFAAFAVLAFGLLMLVASV